MVTMPYGPPTEPIHVLGPWVAILVVFGVGAAVGVWYARRLEAELVQTAAESGGDSSTEPQQPAAPAGTEAKASSVSSPQSQFTHPDVDDPLGLEDDSRTAARSAALGQSTAGAVALDGAGADATFELPRRKVLGAVATIGTAAAVGGAGTVSFFSDQETFANNQLVTGELDLTVDWEEHYSDWSDDEAAGIDVSMTDSSVGPGFPSAAPEKMVYVSDADTFLDNTVVEAFPDTTDLDEEDYDGTKARFENDSDICDLSFDETDPLSHPFRTGATVDGGVTIGGEPNPQTTQAGDPLVDISDLKPGDFGEVTFSFHLCGNPGYVWLTGALREALENGVTEPEGDSSLEESGVVELLDAIQVAFWYDTGADLQYGADYDDKDTGEGDNFFTTDEGEGLISLRGSLGDVLGLLEESMFPLDAEPVSSVDGNGDGGIEDEEFPDHDVVQNTDDATLYVSTEEPFNAKGARNLTCRDYGETLDIDGLVGSAIEARVDEDGDGEEEDFLANDTAFSACGGTLTVDNVDIDGGSITVSSDFPVRIVSVKGGNQGENIYVWDDPGVILDGVTLSTPDSAAISNIDVCCGTGDGNGGGGQQNGARQCFPNSTTAYVGFEWWIPLDVGNEIQTDSVAFDLGFYTEQCRHNDGGGIANREG